jgi:hypothetical protein
MNSYKNIIFDISQVVLAVWIHSSTSTQAQRYSSCSKTLQMTWHSVPLPSSRLLQLPSRNSKRKEALSVFPVKKPGKPFRLVQDSAFSAVYDNFIIDDKSMESR